MEFDDIFQYIGKDLNSLSSNYNHQNNIEYYDLGPYKYMFYISLSNRLNHVL